MAERSLTSVGQKRPLYCLFSFASILFILSWLFLLRSTDHHNFLDYDFLPNAKRFVGVGGGNAEPLSHSGNIPSITSNAVILEEQFEAPRKDGLVKCNPNDAALKVYMYDLPPEFHFGLLDWKPEGKGVWPDVRTSVPRYPGGLNLQHSIEYWLTLDLLSSEFADPTTPRSAIRVHNSSEADVIFVPFFSSLSSNRHAKVKPPEKKSLDKLLQERLVKFLTAQEEWKRSGGRDHIVMAHHPNSLLDARAMLWPATFILSDFGRYPPNIANVDKDVIAPYMHVIRNFVNDSSDFDSRQTLMYFQGAIYRKDGGFVRQELFYLLKDEKDVHFSFGSIRRDGVHKATEGMHSSKFCLNLAGDTPSSNRLFDAIASHCVPVIISDDIELPYEDVLDYTEFCIFVRSSDALKGKFLINLIRGIGREEWTRMWSRLKEVEKFFEFQYPSQEGDAVNMIWKAIARKVPDMRMRIHRLGRFSRYPVPRDRKLQSIRSRNKFR